MKSHHPTRLQLEHLCALKPLARHLVFPVQVSPRSQMTGHYLSRLKGQGMEFDDVRVYQAGDDIRNIDWRVTARTGETHTKQFRQEKEHPVWLCCDFSGVMQFGSQCQLKSIVAGHLLAMLCWHAKHRRDKVGGIVFNNTQAHRVHPENTEKAIYALLSHSCDLQNKQRPTLADSTQTLKDKLHELARIANPGSFICIITDWSQQNENLIKPLRQLTERHNVMLYHICDPLEQLENDANIPNLVITDGQHTQYSQLPMRSSLSMRDNEFLHAVSPNMVTFSTAQPLSEQILIKRRPVYA